jgi:hypothetical protein
MNNMDLKLRRRINKIEKILDVILDGLHVCDYSSNDEFFSAVEYAFHEFWSFYKGDGNIQDIEWEHVEELISDYLNEQIRSYYDERYENCEESDELTEYPNFVYESTEDLPNRLKRRISISDETWKELFDSVDVMDHINFDNWIEEVMNSLAYVDNLSDLSYTELDQVIKYFEKDPKVFKMAQDYYTQKLSHNNIPYAVFEIIKPLAHMSIEYYYQEAPFWKTQESRIFIKKGAAGSKSISTDNIKVLKVFPEGDSEELQNYLENLRSKIR